MKKLLLISFLLSLFMLPYSTLYAQVDKTAEVVQGEQSNITLTVTADSVHIKNANVGSVIEIYNILGLKINSYVIDSADKIIPISLPTGYYIFKIGNIVRKVVVK